MCGTWNKMADIRTASYYVSKQTTSVITKVDHATSKPHQINQMPSESIKLASKTKLSHLNIVFLVLWRQHKSLV